MDHREKVYEHGGQLGLNRIFSKLQQFPHTIDNSLCIGSGHLSASEILAMVNSSPLELRQKMIITHVNWSIFRLKNEEIENLKTKGVYFELTLAPVYSSQFKSQSIKDILKLIYLIGIDKCIISSDLGQIGSIDPMKAINKACDELRKEGLNDNQIEKLFSYNAGKFLDF